ncbi:MAG: amidohydrolase [Cyclobacteriaceae bacterium]
MHKNYKLSLLSLLVLFTLSCDKKGPSADMVILGGIIHTVDATQPKADAVAIISDKIAFVGSRDEADNWIGDSTKVLNLKGKTITPGFIEGHAHLMGIGNNLINLDLSQLKSYSEVVQAVKRKVETSQPGEWILGRGWHQDKWDEQPENIIGGFPSHHDLSSVSPDNPVLLGHASGHAALANAKAMELAKVDRSTQAVEGGEIFKDLGGNPSGIFNETAVGLIRKIVPDESKERNMEALRLALDHCAENGITSFHDAGADSLAIGLYKEFGEIGHLPIRLYIMLNGGNVNLINAYSKHGPQIGLFDDFLTIRAIKLYADGALGSRGALLLEEYEDAPGVHGHRIQDLDFLKKITQIGFESGFQVCTHCIGDRANREVLDLYQTLYSSKKGDYRFRIEHAQHIAEEDIPRFGELGVIPSMQAIHMSSDRPWAIDRLGKKRIVEGAYVWNKLTESGATIVNGTDAPVEPINPIACFFAAVSRQTLKGEPTGGYEPEQRMTRQEALQSYTINNAYGAFEENIKGSIEVGKLADLTVFSQDIMEVPIDKLLETEIEYTIVGGRIIYKKP